MVARQFIALSCFTALCSCTSAPPASSGDRCGPTPRLLVSASTFPVPPANAVSPVVIAESLVANASDLYYVISIGADNPPSVSPYLAGNVMRVPLAGGLPTEIASGFQFTKPTFTATSVILGEINAYPNSDNDAIVSVPLAGGSPTSIVSLPGGGLPTGDVLLGNPVSDGAYVYFEDSYGIEAVPLAGGPGGAAMALLNSLGSQGDLAIFGQQLIFLQGFDVDSISLPAQANSPVATLATFDGSAQPQSMPPAPFSFASQFRPCGSEVCWLEIPAGSEKIGRMDPAGAGVVERIQVPAGLFPIRDFVFDGMHFFMLTGHSDETTPVQLARLNLDGSDPAILATMSPGMSGAVAVDDECVYWSNPLGIFNLAKTAEGPFAQ